MRNARPRENRRAPALPLAPPSDPPLPGRGSLRAKQQSCYWPPPKRPDPLPLLRSAVHLQGTGGTCNFYLSRSARRERWGVALPTTRGVEGGPEGPGRMGKKGVGWCLGVDVERVQHQRSLVQSKCPARLLSSACSGLPWEQRRSYTVEFPGTF